MHSLEIAEDRSAIRERLAALRPDDARVWGVMSAAEMVCHLRGAFRVAMGELPSDPISLPVPQAVVKAAALWAPLPWKRNFLTVPSLRAGAPAMQTGEFEADRSEMLAEMERFCTPEQRRVDHAFLGPMSFGDWMRWGFLHTDHHLRQFGR